MKKILLLVLVICGIMFAPFMAKADVIPPNEHGVSQCVKIDNSLNNKLSGFYIVGYYEGPMVDGHEAYIVKTEDGSSDNTTACLEKGYKINNFNLLAIRKSYLDKVGLKNIDINNPDVYINEDITLNAMTVSNSNPMDSITEIYSIDGISNGKLLLDKEKQTTSYNDGTQDKVETFEDTNCVLESCSGHSTFKCVREKDLDKDMICTEIYEIGSNCLEFASCSNTDNCQADQGKEYTNCKTCVEQCYNNNSDSEFDNISDCASQCSSSEVINQGKSINTSPTPTPNPTSSPTSTPTKTENPIKKLVSTGVSTVIIILSVLVIIILSIIYIVSKNKNK